MAFVEQLFRIRIAVLALLVVAGIAAFWLAFRGHEVPVGALFLAGVSLFIAATVNFIHLRHAGLALVQALAPLPGLAAAGRFGVDDGLTLSGFLAIYGFALIVGTCLAGDIVRRILQGSDRLAAARESFMLALAPLLVTIIASSLAAFAWLFHSGATQGVGAAAVMAAAVVSAVLVLPFAASVFPYGETFFTQANRARERRERMLRPVTAVLTPRWGLSITGIALVLVTLAVFGAPWLAQAPVPLVWFGSIGVMLFLCALVMGRDWREALAIAASLLVLALLGLWLEDRATGHAGAAIFVVNGAVVAASFFLSLMLAGRARQYIQASELHRTARLRAVEDFAVPAALGAISAAGAIAPWIVLHGSIAMIACLLPLGAATAFFLGQGIAAAIGWIAPRRLSLNELYGRG